VHWRYWYMLCGRASVTRRPVPSVKAEDLPEIIVDLAPLASRSDGREVTVISLDKTARNLARALSKKVIQRRQSRKVLQSSSLDTSPAHAAALSSQRHRVPGDESSAPHESELAELSSTSKADAAADGDGVLVPEWLLQAASAMGKAGRRARRSLVMLAGATASTAADEEEAKASAAEAKQETEDEPAWLIAATSAVGPIARRARASLAVLARPAATANVAVDRDGEEDEEPVWLAQAATSVGMSALGDAIGQRTRRARQSIAAILAPSSLRASQTASLAFGCGPSQVMATMDRGFLSSVAAASLYVRSLQCTPTWEVLGAQPNGGVSV
jgi:hypothetical protein